MKRIVREELLEKLELVQGSPDIKVITGVRRCGKSELLRAFFARVKKKLGEKANIVAIDFTDLQFEQLKEYRELHSYIVAHFVPNKRNFLCIDEVQMCDKFELAINSIHAMEKWDIYLTGSNAFMLSSDLATLFTGRHIEIPVYPFSFKEFRAYFGAEDVDRQFDEYVRLGGMAGSYVYTNPEARMQYDRTVYDTIINRDLIDRHSIQNVAAFHGLADFMMDNVGNLESANSIAHALSNKGDTASHVTIANHISHLCDAFLFYKIKRFDIKGKRYLNTNDKYYLVDQGFRWAVLGTRNMDYGRMYENIVAIELMRRGWNIYVGKLYQKEVDFVAVRDSKTIYIQVCDDFSREETIQREIDPLLRIRNAHPKLVLARTKHEEYDLQGVRICDIARWLAE